MFLPKQNLILSKTKMTEQKINTTILKNISILFKKINDEWNKAESIHQQIEARKQEALLNRIKSDFPKMF